MGNIRGKTWKPQDALKKTQAFLVPNQRCQDSRHFLQKPKYPKAVMGLNYPTQRFIWPNYLDVDMHIFMGLAELKKTSSFISVILICFYRLKKKYSLLPVMCLAVMYLINLIRLCNFLVVVGSYTEKNQLLPAFCFDVLCFI